MMTSSSGFLLLDTDKLTSFFERDFVDSKGRYFRSMTIEVSDNDEFDLLNQFWGFTKSQSKKFKAQTTHVRVIVEELPVWQHPHVEETVAIKDTPTVPEESPETGEVSAVNDQETSLIDEGVTEDTPDPTNHTLIRELTALGMPTSVHREKTAHTRSGRVFPPPLYSCHDEEEHVFKQRLLIHDIHEIVKGPEQEGPDREKFTLRAGFFESTISCPQLRVYLRDHIFERREPVGTCYAKARPYRSKVRPFRDTDPGAAERTPGTEGEERMGTHTRSQETTHRETKQFVVNGEVRDIPVVKKAKVLRIRFNGEEIYRRGTTKGEEPRVASNSTLASNDNRKTSTD